MTPADSVKSPCSPEIGTDLEVRSTIRRTRATNVERTSKSVAGRTTTRFL